jgi:DNA repair exonuclease SbcCD ATPase subunit
MFLIASRSPLQNHSTEEIAQSLILSPEGRMVQALLDLELQLKNMHEKWGEAEADRTARLDRIRELTRLFQESEADRAARLEVIHRFGHKIDELNGQVNELNGQVNELNGQVNELNGQVNVLNEQIGEWEKNFFFRVLRKFHLLSRRERKRFPAQTPEKS